MKRQSRKLVALILCVGMFMSLFNGVAFAEGENVQDDIQTTEPAAEANPENEKQLSSRCIEGCILPEGHEGECQTCLLYTSR